MIDLAIPYNTSSPSSTKEEMMLMYEILEWLMTQIHDSSILLKGCEGNVTFNDIEHQKWRTMIMGHSPSAEQEILKILQQPPPNYREKYIACIVNGEPEGVKEIENEGMSDSPETKKQETSDEGEPAAG